MRRGFASGLASNTTRISSVPEIAVHRDAQQAGLEPSPSSAEPGLLPPDAMYERALRWTAVAIVSVIVFGGLYFGVRMLE